jgi:hypothetical protein
MLWLLPCYFLIRPLCTLLPELSRALLMLTWSRNQSVEVHLGSRGHDRGLFFRLGRLNFRVHPYFLLFRGSISDTLAQPSTRQFFLWNASSLLCSAAILGTCTILLLGRLVPDAALPFLGIAGLLSLTDFGLGTFREYDPICMRCGLVHTGPGPALQTLFRYRHTALDFLRAVRHYLRDDYRAALIAYQPAWEAGQHTEELLEDMLYAQMVLGQDAAAIATYDTLVAAYAPSATQSAVAAYAHWRLGDRAAAFACADAAVHTAYAQPVARNYRAWLYLQIGNPQAALADLDVALAASEEYACAYSNRARALFALERVDEARADILLALRHDPMDIDALRAAAMIFEATGELSQARQARERLAYIAPQDPQP